MKNVLLQWAIKLNNERKRRKSWQKLVQALSVIVVFCTAYALILPAITMEKDVICGFETHAHTDECYTQQTVYALGCPSVEADVIIHKHDALCYDENGALLCGLTEKEVHAHTDACYVTEGELVCTEPETAGHAHSDACYASVRVPCAQAETEGHVCTEDCAVTEQELVCTEAETAGHTHGDDCCVVGEPALVCGKDELALHSHGDSCYIFSEDPSVAPVLTCTKAAVVEHVHTEACLTSAMADVQICALEAHEHTDACYPEVLYAAEPTPEYVCNMGEHTHGDECLDEAGEPVCTIPEHTHRDACKAADLEQNEGGANKQPEVDEQAEAAKAMIQALPTAESAIERLNTLNAALDRAEFDTYLQQLTAEAAAVREAYDALDDDQKLICGEIGALEALEQLLSEVEWQQLPSLTDDNAYVSALAANGVQVDGGERTADKPTAYNGSTVAYGFTAKLSSRDNTVYGDARMKLEFTLPVSKDIAEFDMTAMSWLENPVLTEQAAAEDVPAAQVLSGYVTLQAESFTKGAVPSEFTGDAVIRVLAMEHNSELRLEISAAMEYNTWDGVCAAHETEEKCSIATDVVVASAQASEEEQAANYEGFVAEREALLASALSEEEKKTSAEELWNRICECSLAGGISDEQYYELGSLMVNLLYGENHEVGEMADRKNFLVAMEEVKAEIQAAQDTVKTEDGAKREEVDLADAINGAANSAVMQFSGRAVPASTVQITNVGSEDGVTSSDGVVWVNKSIKGTDMENVFDITLDIITKQQVNEVYTEPDMAVVVVMDISETMNAAFGDTTRYKAAVVAAENFIEQFASNNLGASQLGFVAFNTDAHEIFALQQCSDAIDADQAENLIAEMKSETSAIIGASGYASSHSRFTNIEAGLKRAQDMLDAVDNENKYVVFLSDGFPTTYLNTGTSALYDGYDPYDSSGSRFYDSVEKYNGKNRPCSAGTSYSDPAAQKASAQAEKMKEAGTVIFSIGVDVNGQTVENYVNAFTGRNFSVVDRRNTNYEVYTAGQDTGLSKYETWLKKDIGSNYYYQSSNSTGLTNAFNSIFQEIKELNASSAHLDWVTGDPMGDMGIHEIDAVEFLGFYDKDGNLVNSIDENGVLTSVLIGASGDGWDYENSATFDSATNTIHWDLKNSRYITSTLDNITLFECQLTYRVRLKNEEASFEEDHVSTNGAGAAVDGYWTNDETSLTYRVIDITNDVVTVSEQRSINYPIPAVEGYVEDLTFKKVNSMGKGLAGAEFTLTHDTDSCGLCCGDGKRSVDIAAQTQVSQADGTVTFTNVPSGHKYILNETVVPDGHKHNGYSYAVEVAYNVITVTTKDADGNIVLDENGNPLAWTGSVENFTEYVLPNTGGAGTEWFTFGGMLLIASVGVYICVLRHKRRKGSG